MLNINSINGISSGISICRLVERVKITAARNEAEPIACAKKYFIAASVSWLAEERVIKGIIDKRLSSILVHIIIQLFLDRAIIVESPKVEENKEEKGYVEIIKIEWELNPLD